ncbi:hypothetical protein BBJ28_00012477 [Nothophytophthora sp. Chile5]|nr:hypothetical protein BBJ28_00012477 [Nothophytophthora sp. Chile5]
MSPSYEAEKRIYSKEAVRKAISERETNVFQTADKSDEARQRRTAGRQSSRMVDEGAFQDRPATDFAFLRSLATADCRFFPEPTQLQVEVDPTDSPQRKAIPARSRFKALWSKGQALRVKDVVTCCSSLLRAEIPWIHFCQTSGKAYDAASAAEVLPWSSSPSKDVESGSNSSSVVVMVVIVVVVSSSDVETVVTMEVVSLLNVVVPSGRYSELA